MSAQIWLAFAIVLVVTVLLVTEKLRPDVTAVGLMAFLGLTGLVKPQEAFAGFSQSSLITILSVYILTAGLERTGVTSVIAQQFRRMAGNSETRLLLLIITTGAALSLFMNNVAAVAVILPALVSISRQSNTPASKLLLPLAYAVTLGGMTTLFTTSNILVNDALHSQNILEHSMLDFLPLGGLIVLVGGLYLLTIGRKLLPEHRSENEGRKTVTAAQLAEAYHLQEGISQFYIKPGSALAGEYVYNQYTHNLGINVIGISRGGEVLLSPSHKMRTFEGDVLLAGGNPPDEELDNHGLVRTHDPTWKGELNTGEIGLVEVILSPRSAYANQTLKELHFREQFGVNVIAVWRGNNLFRSQLGDLPLRWGDALLVQGPQEKIRFLHRDANLLVLDTDTGPMPGNPRKGLLAVAITLTALALATLRIVPLANAMFGAAALMVLLNLLTMDEAYQSVSWRSLFLMAGFIPLGTLLEKSGAANVVGASIVGLLGDWGPAVVVGGLFLVTAIAVQVLGNVGTAVIFAPIAINTALNMGSDPRAFAMAVTLGTSMVFLIPTSHPANVMIMGPGSYRVRDFIKVGWGMTLVVTLVVLMGLPFFWHLF
jgi:di/tricarboxylate transporter